MQIKSRGIRLDLRTLIHGYMSPSQIRTVMATAQKLRTMFFQSHICFIYINTYISIRTMLLNVCLRERETERYRKIQGDQYGSGLFLRAIVTLILDRQFSPSFLGCPFDLAHFSNFPPYENLENGPNHRKIISSLKNSISFLFLKWKCSHFSII